MNPFRLKSCVNASQNMCIVRCSANRRCFILLTASFNRKKQNLHTQNCNLWQKWVSFLPSNSNIFNNLYNNSLLIIIIKEISSLLWKVLYKKCLNWIQNISLQVYSKRAYIYYYIYDHKKFGIVKMSESCFVLPNIITIENK